MAEVDQGQQRRMVAPSCCCSCCCFHCYCGGLVWALPPPIVLSASAVLPRPPSAPFHPPSWPVFFGRRGTSIRARAFDDQSIMSLLTPIVPDLIVNFTPTGTGMASPLVLGKQGQALDVDLDPTYAGQAFTFERLLVSVSDILPQASSAVTEVTYAASMLSPASGSVSDPDTWNWASLIKISGYTPATPLNPGYVLAFIATLTSCPTWLSFDGTTTGLPPSAGSAWAVWMDIVTKIVCRLRFYTSAVKYIEVWNEPDLSGSMTFPTSYKDNITAYIDLYLHTVTAINAFNAPNVASNVQIAAKNVATTAANLYASKLTPSGAPLALVASLPVFKVGGPAVSLSSLTLWSDNMFLNAGITNYIDFLSFHSHPGTPHALAQDATDIQKWVTSAKAAPASKLPLPIFITDWNAVTPFSGVAGRLSQFLASGLTGSTMSAMANVNTAGVTETSLVYPDTDPENPPGHIDYQPDAGPAVLLSTALNLGYPGNGIVPPTIILQSVVPSATPSVYITTSLAALNPLGQMVVFLTNDTPTSTIPLTYSTVTGLPTCTALTISVTGLLPRTYYQIIEFESSATGKSPAPRRVSTMATDVSGAGLITGISMPAKSAVGMLIQRQTTSRNCMRPAFHTFAMRAQVVTTKTH